MTVPHDPKTSAYFLTEHSDKNAAYWAGRYHELRKEIDGKDEAIAGLEGRIKSYENMLKIVPKINR